MNYFLFNDPWRRWLRQLTWYLPDRMADPILRALYPPDMLLEFSDDWSDDDDDEPPSLLEAPAIPPGPAGTAARSGGG